MSNLENTFYERALQIAAQAHAGQVDKAGQPYIEHPLRVAERCTSVAAKCIGLLHDIIEDTSITEEDLREAMMSEEIIAAVLALTQRPHEPREDYYKRIKQYPLALEVKLADIADNSLPERLALLDVPTRQRLEQKYAKALRILSA